MILFGLMGSLHGLCAQDFSGAESYGTEYEDYLYDIEIINGNAYQLIKQELFTYPETVYASMLHGLDIRVNPLYLGNEYSNLKLSLDTSGNVYLTGIYTQRVVSDTSYLFVSKLNHEGNNVWTQLYQKRSDTVEIYNDRENYLYIHDKHVLYKIDYSGNLIWAKNHFGNTRLYKKHFYTLIYKNIHDFYIKGLVCDSIILQKSDTSGNTIFQKTINTGMDDNTMISSNCVLNILDDRLFISNSYWGMINVAPSNSDNIFENKKTSYTNEKWGYAPVFNNYLAIYDTIGNLLSANSKANYPHLNYACKDSYGSLYFSGNMGTVSDFDLKTSESLIYNKSEKDISFIAKYSNKLDFYWCRGVPGLIKYIGISNYPNGGEEKLDIAGEFEGTINLNFERPDDITFTGEGRDLFYAKYINLDKNISPTTAENKIGDESYGIYPNPGDGIINLIGNFEDKRVEIYDLTGKLKYCDNLCFRYNQKTLDLSHLNNGYYLIRILSKDKIYTNKILINK